MTQILFKNAHLLTMQGSGVGYIKNGAVGVENGRISHIGTTEELAGLSAEEVIDCQGMAIMPGLVDIHMHTPLAIVRGVAQDIWNWMQAGLAPYSKHITPEASLAGTRLNVLEAVKAGTTLVG